MADFGSNPILNAVLNSFLNRVQVAFQTAVKDEGLVSSGELENSIRSGGVDFGKDWISGHIYFSDLLRVKDMKFLNYSTIPPLAPLVNWVERTGVENFPYVPGFKEGEESESEIRNIYRIASAIQYKLKGTPNVRRGYRGVYNDQMKYNLLPQFYDDMRAAVSVYAKQAFYASFGYEVHIYLPEWGINAERIQSAWNARDTQLERKYNKEILGIEHKAIQGPKLPSKLK